MPQYLKQLAVLLDTEQFSQFLRFKKWTAPDGVVYMGYTIRTPRWRLVEWYPWDEEKQKCGKLAATELYDHQNDPQENVNVAGLAENRPIIAQLAEQLEASRQAAASK